jgi:hypothetical protein
MIINLGGVLIVTGRLAKFISAGNSLASHLCPSERSCLPGLEVHPNRMLGHLLRSAPLQRR